MRSRLSKLPFRIHRECGGDKTKRDSWFRRCRVLLAALFGSPASILEAAQRPLEFVLDDA